MCLELKELRQPRLDQKPRRLHEHDSEALLPSARSVLPLACFLMHSSMVAMTSYLE
jgi:hypothetical protein